MIALKCIKQNYTPDRDILNMLEIFRCMVNHCLRIGLQSNVSTLKQLSLFSYHELSQYDILSYYKLCAISKACGILANRKQSINRGKFTKNPYMKKSILISYYGFKLENGVFNIPIGDKKYFEIPLSTYTNQILSNPSLKVRSFTLTPSTFSVTISKEMTEIQCTKTAGIDRNLYNITFGNWEEAIQYDLSKTIHIAENTRSIISSFKRNDHRMRQKLYSKYGQRRKNRINQILHKVSKTIVENAMKNKQAIVFEDIRHIRKMYKRGNTHGRKYRYKMNGWSFEEIKRQIEYKAKWNGIPLIQLTKRETMGTSSLCPRCGKRFQDKWERNLWCKFCQRWTDRDVVAVMNQSLRGLLRFSSSKGVASEAVIRNREYNLTILRVDATKLAQLTES